MRMPAGEDEPAVEYGSTAVTAATGPDSNCRYGSLDDVAEADIVVGDEPRKAHSVRLGFSFFCLSVPWLFCVHGTSLLA